MDGGSFHSATAAIEQFHKEIGPNKRCCLFGFGVVPSASCEKVLDEILCDPSIQDDEQRGCAYYKICDVLREEWKQNSYRASSQIFCLQTTKNIYTFARNITLKIHTKRRVERTTGVAECQESVRISYGGFKHEDGHTESIITYEYLDKLGGKVYESDSLEEGYMIPDDVNDKDRLQYNVLPLDAPISMIVVDMITAKKKKNVLGDLTTKDLRQWSAVEIKNELYIDGHIEQVIYVQHMRPSGKSRISKGELRLDLPHHMDSNTARDAERIARQITSTESTLTPVFIGYTPEREMEEQMNGGDNYYKRLKPLVVDTMDTGIGGSGDTPALALAQQSHDVIGMHDGVEHVNPNLQIDHANHRVFQAAVPQEQSRPPPTDSTPRFRQFYESRLVMESPMAPGDSGQLVKLDEAEKESPTMILPYVDFSSFTQRYKGMPLSGPSSRHGSKKMVKPP